MKKISFVGQLSQKRNYVILAIIILLNAISHWGYTYGDSAAYTTNANYFFNYTNEARSEPFIYRPVISIFSGSIAPLFGLINSFSIVNTIFMILSSTLLYKFVLELYGREKLALYSAVLFSTSIPLLRFGFAVLSDGGAYLFSILIIYLIYKLKENATIREIALLSIIFAVGFLTKENVVAISLIYLMLSKHSQINVLKKGMVIIILASVIAGSYYLAFNIDPLKHFFDAPSAGYTYDNEAVWGVKRLVLSFGGFLYLPLFAILGFLADKDKKRLLNYYYVLISFLPLFAWHSMEYRITFNLFPLVMPLAALGIESFSSILSKKPVFEKLKQKHFEMLIIVAYIVLSFFYVLLYHPK